MDEVGSSSCLGCPGETADGRGRTPVWTLDAPDPFPGPVERGLWMPWTGLLQQLGFCDGELFVAQQAFVSQSDQAFQLIGNADVGRHRSGLVRAWL